jgi:DNA polymerase III alpha subunit
MEEIIPCFSSHFSAGRSILTLDEPGEIEQNTPNSVFSIAKKYGLKKIFIRDNTYSGFVSAYKNTPKAAEQLVWGVKMTVCEDAARDPKETENTESYISLWAKDSAGCNDLIKLYSNAIKNRLDWNILKKFYTPNILVSVSFFGGFIHNNNLRMHNCIPDFGGIPYWLEIQDKKLPFNDVLKELVIDFGKKENRPLLLMHSIYYYSRADFKAYQVHRINSTRGGFSMGDDKQSIRNPGLDFFCDDSFSFEE